jgi:hypothetical protein
MAASLGPGIRIRAELDFESVRKLSRPVDRISFDDIDGRACKQSFSPAISWWIDELGIDFSLQGLAFSASQFDSPIPSPVS